MTDAESDLARPADAPGGGPVTYRVATIPGDGVGPDVVAAARAVVDAVAAADRFAVDWSEHLVGGIAIGLGSAFVISAIKGAVALHDIDRREG